MNVDVVRQRLLEGDEEVVLKELVDLYRRADVLHTAQLARILDALFPVWKTLLQSRLPPQQRATQANRCRKVLLQILNRLPSNDALRPYVSQLLHLLMEVLYRDNEDNALIALKTVFDLHRNYRPGLRSEVQAFLDLVQQMYKNVHVTMRTQFTEAPPKVKTPAPSPREGGGGVAAATIAAASSTTTAATMPVTTTTTTTATVAVAVTATAAEVVTKAEEVTDTAQATASTNAPTIVPAVPASVSVPAVVVPPTSDEQASSAVSDTAVPVTTEVKSEPAEGAVTAAPAASAAAVVASDSKMQVDSSAAAIPTVVASSAVPPAVDTSAPAPAQVAAPAVSPPPSPVVVEEEPLWSSMESFKAISELPLIIMLLFQCYSTYIESHVPVLVPLMMNLLSLRAPESAVRLHPARYVNFLDCQVKTLSFVTYLLRGCAPLMRPFQDAICENTVKLLTVCPKDAFVLRKDIFVAARLIISTEFRRGFYSQLELLMDDEVLIGRGRCSFHQIRPLAYSTLADMIHHVRDMLTLAQVSRIVDFYGKRIHDATLPISIQTTSIRLLLNLVDICSKNDDDDGWKGRNILSRILLIIASKFGATLRSLPVALGLSVRSDHAGSSSAAVSSDLLDGGGAMDKIRQSSLLPKVVHEKTPQETKLDELLLPYLESVPRGAVGVITSDEEPCIRDVKSLLRTMILGVRAVIWCTANYRNPHAKDLTSMDAAASGGGGSGDSVVYGSASASGSAGGGVLDSSSARSGHAAATAAAASVGDAGGSSYPLNDDERKLIARVLQNGLRCFILYTLSDNTLAEEKQMLDHFAGAFTVLDAPDFRDLFISNMPLLYDCILQDHAILTIPQHFLANSKVSCWFAEILLKFLIAQMKDLSVAADGGDGPDLPRDDKLLQLESLRFERMRVVKQEHCASIVLRLFKIVFGSVTLFKSNESALFPHLRTIIECCLKEATFTKHPDNFLLLLRALFRSISGGKYENFYKEVFPLLPGILSALMRLQKHIQKPSLQEVILELCLTIPARLSSLLQYLPSLMKSVVCAILSRGELAYLGLRTLEFWVDNLNPDFLYPIMTSQDRLLTEIIEALNSHLLPPPYPYGELSMRILGKIGGRNRQYLMDPLSLAVGEPLRKALVVQFAWKSSERECGNVDDDAVSTKKKTTATTKTTKQAAAAFSLKMDVVLQRAAVVLHRYHRKSVHEWEHLVKTDARLNDADEYDDHGNHHHHAQSHHHNSHGAAAAFGGGVGGGDASLAAAGGGATLGMAAAASLSLSSSTSLLLEKDDKTLELESHAAVKVKNAILRYKKYAFDVLVSAATIAMYLTEDVGEEEDVDMAVDGGGGDDDVEDGEGEEDEEDDNEEDDEHADDPMNGASAESTATDGAAGAAEVAEPWENTRATRQSLLCTLFETMDDVDFGPQATQLLMRAAVQLTKAVVDVCDRQKPNFAALSSLHPSSLLPGNRGMSPGRHLATAKRIDVLRQASYGTPVLMEPKTSRVLALYRAFAGAILDGLSSPNGQVVDGAKSVLQRVVATALAHYDDGNADLDGHTSAAYQCGALFHLLCDVFAHACYDKTSWRVKLGGVAGLQLLVDALAAPFCHENELVIVKALFFVLSDHPSEVSATVSVEAGDALVQVVEKAHLIQSLDVEAFSNGAITGENFRSCMAFQETEIFQMFVVEFLSPKAPARRYARLCITKVAAFAGTTESAMLFSYQQLISKQITGSPLRSLAFGTRIGYVDAMAHALSIQPSIFPMTKELMTFLQDVWRLISEDTNSNSTSAAGSSSSAAGISDASTPSHSQSSSNSSNSGGSGSSSSSSANNNGNNCPVSAQEYPFGLSQGCELRIATVKLFRAAFLAAPDELNAHHDARGRFVSVFFRYLTRQPLELVTCAQQALSDVIQLNKQHKEITLPKELLQQCLRPVLLNLADYRKLNLPLLDGLSRLLTLLSSCFNVTLGEKLLEHLKQWRDPERIMKAGIWKRGDEPAVAAAIIGLFHLLPPNETFLDALVECVVDLEAVLPKYGSYGKMSSPYRVPLTKFLNRYANSAVAFFLKREHLIQAKYSSLFQELLKLPDALPLRNVILREGGAESMMAATFVAASKTSTLDAAAAAAAAASSKTVPSQATTPVAAAAVVTSGGGGVVDAAASEDIKMQAQIQLNAQKAAAQAVASAQAQGLGPSVAEARGMQARAAYVAKATAQVNAQQALKVQSQVQIQANAQKLHAQTLAAAQAQGLSLVQAQAKAQFASKDYIAKAQSQVAASTALPSPISSVSSVSQLPSPSASASPHHVTQLQAQQLHAQIQVNAQKVHAQALAAAHAQGLKPIQAQEKAKQAQATYVHRAKAQAQAKIARAQSFSGVSSSTPTTPTAVTASSTALSTAAAAAANAASLITSKSQLEALELLYQGLRVVRTVSKIHPQWLASQPVLVDTLRKLWRSPGRVQRLAAQEKLPIRFHYETKLLLKILVGYCQAKQDDVHVLLELLTACVHKSSSFDFSFVLQFYHEIVAKTYSPANKRQIVRLFLRMLRDATTSDELKVHAVQSLIMPILTTSFEDASVHNADVMDAETVQWMLREILASKDMVVPVASSPAAAGASTVTQQPSDAMLMLRIELLKLGTLLIQHMSKFVTDHRKEVIKFAWNHLKASDLTSKLYAYVNVCRFISVYDTPPKIVLQVYVALLRTFEMDARFLVRRAFDILLPALPSRLPPHEFIKAIKWTKKIAYEEGHSLPQLVHIWFLIVRHPALFYPFRGQFVPLMVNSLNRLAIPPSSTPDNRRLAVNLVDLIIAWEQTRRERVAVAAAASMAVATAAAGAGVEEAIGSDADGARKRRAMGDLATESAASMDQDDDRKKRKVEMSGSDGQVTAVGAGGVTTGGATSTVITAAASPSSAAVAAAATALSEDDFELNAPMVDLVINFAFRFALASADKQETSRLSKTCGELFDKALRLWPSAAVRFSYFDKLIAVTAEAIIRQQQQQQQQQSALAAAASASGAGGATGAGSTSAAAAAVPPPTPVTTMPMFFVVPKGAPLSSLAILDAVLGILNSLITPEVVTKSTRSVPYVVQYAPRVMKLLEPCFDRPQSEIQTGLTTFLTRMIELYPPNRASQELVACRFYPWLKDILQDRLQSAAALQQEFLASLPSNASHAAAAQKAAKPSKVQASAAVNSAGGAAAQATIKTEPKAVGAASPPPPQATGNAAKRQKIGDQAATKTKMALAAHASRASGGSVPPSVFAAETTLRLLAVLCEHQPDFTDQFAASLLKLAQFFTREHLLHCAAAAASSSIVSTHSSHHHHGSSRVLSIGGGGGAGGGGGSTTAAHLSQDTSTLSDSMTRHRVMATPSLAITDEWHRMQSGRSMLSVNNIVRQLKKKEPAATEKAAPTKSKKQSAAAAAAASGATEKESTTSGTKASTSSASAKKKGSAAAAGSAVAAASAASSASQHAGGATTSGGGGGGAGGGHAASAAASGLVPHKLAVELLTMCLRLVSKCALASGDHRRVYTNLLVHCLESSTNIPLLLQITQIVGHAITSSATAAANVTNATNATNVLTPKDKMTLLTKMITFDRLPEVAALPLWGEYYQLILQLCDPTSDVKHSYFHISPALTQSHSLTTHFMAGLLAPDPAVREQFLQYFYDAAKTSATTTTRLELVLRQDWQSCGSRYWMAVAVETMLSAAAGAARDEPSSRRTRRRRRSSNNSTSGNASALSSPLSPHQQLLQSMRYLAHVDVELAENLWVQLFDDAWKRLATPQQRSQVASQLLKQLSSKFNKRDLHMPLVQDSASAPSRGRVNVVQTLMESLVTVSPSTPVLPPELVLHLASAYDVWGAATRLCEFQVENASLSVDSRLRWIETLSSIYKALSDDDLRVGLSLQHIAQPETRSALVLEALGCVHEAQEEYFKALSKAQSGRVSMDDVNLFELRLWEERWVACAKQLCQWQLMHDFAKATQNQELLLDCVWKRGDWNGAKQLLNLSLGTTQTGSGAGAGGGGTSSVLAAASQGNNDLAGLCPHTRLQRLYIAILDSDKRVTVDTLASQTAELALFQWQGLPRVLGKSHVSLLHLFHQFVEVKESIQMMSDIKHASQLHSLPNLKPSINTWRERLPNKWEPILLWDDILTWRSHMFQVVKSTFSWSDAQMLACMHDSPWSVIRLAHTARKQHLPDVCLGALSKLYQIPAMDVQDAFSKLREQVSICYESASEYSGGLAILNNTNLDYFSLRQKAEMFRLKALFLEAMGHSSEANQTFSYCLQICDSYGKGWLSWGHYCYRLFLASSSSSSSSSSGSSSSHTRELSFASQTIACYLQAIHHRCNAARLMIARVLWLLSMDDPTHGLLIQSFETHGKQLPIWIWIVWIPQLLMALGRPEAPQIRGLLRGLSAKFPQALYYTMRAFFLENRDSAMLQMGERAQSSAPSTPSSASGTGNGNGSSSVSGPGTPTFSGSGSSNGGAGGNAMYYRTKAGYVVAVPSSMPLHQVQQIPGLVAPARPTPTAFGVSPNQVLSVDAWRERLVLGGGGGASDGSMPPGASSSSSSSSISKPELGPVQYTEDLLNFLRRTHDSLTFEMECVLEEMITKFRPEPEEELLTAVHSLLLKCYQLPRLSQRELVPRMLRAALEKVCRKLFAVAVPPPSQSQPQQSHKNEKYLEFVTEFKTSFETDFVPNGPSHETSGVASGGERVTLFEMMDRLKKWRNLLQARGTTLRLEHCSRFLMELGSSNMEVPGQYISDNEPIKDLHARIAYFDNDVDVLVRGGYTQRRLTMGGSDGHLYSFLVQFAMTHSTRTDERMAQMYLLLNRLLLRHKETKKRNAVFHIPKIIPLTPRVRLLEDSRDFVTLGEIYDQHCKSSKRDPDEPMELYRTRISQAYDVVAAAASSASASGSSSSFDSNGLDAMSTQQEDEQLALAKAKAFEEIGQSIVPETLLAKYIFQISTNVDAYFQFRSEFTNHLALSSFLSYVLFVGDRAPHRVLFSRRTARVVSAELRPGYASSGLLEASTSMPFRLTRNLHNFVTRPGVHGPFSVVMAATAEALMGEEDLLSNQLCLFFRDDLLSWHVSKTRMTTAAASTTSANAATSTGPLDSPAASSAVASGAQNAQNGGLGSSQSQAQRQRRLESQVQQRVDANVSLVVERIRGVSLKKETDSQRGKSVRELLEIATSPERQREMNPTWCPWL